MNTPSNRATAGMISRHGILSRENSMTSGSPWALRLRTLIRRGPPAPAGVVLAAMKQLINSMADESTVAMTKRTIIVSQTVVKTALNPSASNHNKSTKKRLNMTSIAKIMMIDAANMRNGFFNNLINHLSRSRFLAGSAIPIMMTASHIRAEWRTVDKFYRLLGLGVLRLQDPQSPRE